MSWNWLLDWDLPGISDCVGHYSLLPEESISGAGARIGRELCCLFCS